MSARIVSSSPVSVPPFVSHRTSVRAPASRAARSVDEGVVAVRLVAVEEVLRVVDELAAALGDEPDAVRDHVEVLGRRGAEHLDDVEQPALAEDRDDRRLGAGELLEVRVGLGAVGAVAGGAERGELRVATSGSPCASRKKSTSFGFEPGQPPSM